jgi:hypothetical protein
MGVLMNKTMYELGDIVLVRNEPAVVINVDNTYSKLSVIKGGRFCQFIDQEDVKWVCKSDFITVVSDMVDTIYKSHKEHVKDNTLDIIEKLKWNTYKIGNISYYVEGTHQEDEAGNVFLLVDTSESNGQWVDLKEFLDGILGLK